MFDTPEWPFTDTVYVMTSATPEEVASWFPNELKPDEIWEGFVEQTYEYLPSSKSRKSNRLLVGLTANKKFSNIATYASAPLVTALINAAHGDERQN